MAVIQLTIIHTYMYNIYKHKLTFLRLQHAFFSFI